MSTSPAAVPLVIELVVPESDPTAGIAQRFHRMASFLADTLCQAGVFAQFGELRGEYCPGTFSILSGGIKLGGVAQRVVAQASLVSAALVVRDGRRVQDVLRSVYDRLEYPFAPSTAGAAEDARPGITVEALEVAVQQRLALEHGVRRVPIDESLLLAARKLRSAHQITTPTESLARAGADPRSSPHSPVANAEGYRLSPPPDVP